ncbi:MAG: hypothetical protein QW054_00265 [Candidatus Micrarchaeia archaeon]
MFVNPQKSKIKSNIHSLFLQIILFLFILNQVSALSCSVTDQNCPSGQICDNGECRECLTSAECWSKTLIRSTPIGGISPWVSISVIVLLISLLGVAIFYMIAYAFQSDQYKRIAFAELMQVLASFLLIAFLFGFEIFETDMLTRLEKTSGAITSALVLQSQGASPNIALSGNVYINPFDVSYAFLRNMITCVQNKLKTTYENSKAIQTIINLNIDVQVITPGKVKFSVPNPLAFTSLSETAAKYEFQASELTWLMIFLYAQIAVLKFIETSMFTVFLPIGLILRAFPPTRGAGAVLVAIAIGFYLIYPLTFTLLYTGTPKQIEGCNLQVAFDYSQLEKTCPLNIGATTQIISSASDLAATLDAAVPQLQAGTSSIRFTAFLYMLISLGVTFIFVRSLSSILGADISEIGRTMLRLL